LVYLAGYGLQVGGENYFVPVDAKIARDSDLPVEGVRIADYIHQLAAQRLRAGIVVVDAARANPFTLTGGPLASGLALTEPDANTLVAFNAAPGTVAPNEPGPYGAYAQALAETIRAGGLTLPEVFDRVRLRVNQTTRGAQVPWNAQRVAADVMFFERDPGAPQAASAEAAQAQTRAIRDFDPAGAYAAALERDTLQGYEEFLAAFPNDPMAPRVRAIVAARREATIWERSAAADAPNAYWSYLRRYPHGPHAADARRRLAELGADLEPPPAYVAFDTEVPPPMPDEVAYMERPEIAFDDPGFAAPPPVPDYFLPPPDPDFAALPPPFFPDDGFFLPVPVFIAIKVFVRVPRHVVPPRNTAIFANIHNSAAVNRMINRPGGPQSGAPANAAAAIAPSLPPSVQQRASAIGQQGPSGPAAGAIGAPNQAPRSGLPVPPGNATHALPNVGSRSPTALPFNERARPIPIPSGQGAANNAVGNNAASNNAAGNNPVTTTTTPTDRGRRSTIPSTALHALPQPGVLPPRAAPVIVNRPAPPPPAIVNRPPPPPLPAIVNRAPPPAMVSRPQPPAFSRPAPPAIYRAPPPAFRAPPQVVHGPPAARRCGTANCR
jgi:uncharacterized caspase-like protein